MNPFKRLLNLLPQRPRQVGTITSISNGVAQITSTGGGIATAIGAGSPGDKVFFRDGSIEGPAPSLPVDNIEV